MVNGTPASCSCVESLWSVCFVWHYISSILNLFSNVLSFLLMLFMVDEIFVIMTNASVFLLFYFFTSIKIKNILNLLLNVEFLFNLSYFIVFIFFCIFSALTFMAAHTRTHTNTHTQSNLIGNLFIFFNCDAQHTQVVWTYGGGKGGRKQKRRSFCICMHLWKQFSPYNQFVLKCSGLKCTKTT